MCKNCAESVCKKSCPPLRWTCLHTPGRPNFWMCKMTRTFVCHYCNFCHRGRGKLGGKGNRERQGKGSREIWKDIMSNDGTFQYVRTNTVGFRNTVLTYGVRNLEPWLQLVFPEPNFFHLLRLYLLSDILLPRLNFVTCTNKIKWEFQFQVYEK